MNTHWPGPGERQDNGNPRSRFARHGTSGANDGANDFGVDAASPSAQGPSRRSNDRFSDERIAAIRAAREARNSQPRPGRRRLTGTPYPWETGAGDRSAEGRWESINSRSYREGMKGTAGMAGQGGFNSHWPSNTNPRSGRDSIVRRPNLMEMLDGGAREDRYNDRRDVHGRRPNYGHGQRQGSRDPRSGMGVPEQQWQRHEPAADPSYGPSRSGQGQFRGAEQGQGLGQAREPPPRRWGINRDQQVGGGADQYGEGGSGTEY